MRSTININLFCILLTWVATSATSASAVSSVPLSLVSDSVNLRASNHLVERISKKDDIDPPEPISPNHSSTNPTVSESPSLVPTKAPSSFPSHSPSNIPSFLPVKYLSFSLSPHEENGAVSINSANNPNDSDTPTSSPLNFIYDDKPSDEARTTSALHTLSLHIFLPNFTTLDGQDISIFERSIRNFVVGHAHEITMPPEVSIQIKTALVVGQVLKWAQRNRVRSLEDDTPLGLNVYYEIDVIATGQISKTQLEDSIQAMFDQNPGLFEEELRYAFARRYGKASELESSSEPEQVPVNVMAATTIGCGVFIAFVLGGLLIYKIKKNVPDEDPPLNSPGGKKQTQILTFKKMQPTRRYPTQQPRKQSGDVLDLEINSIESNDGMYQAHDDSFSVSVAYCPSVFQSEMRVFNVSDPEEESDIEGKMQNDDSGWNTPKPKENRAAVDSTKMKERPRSPILTADDLSAFDADVRRGSF